MTRIVKPLVSLGLAGVLLGAIGCQPRPSILVVTLDTLRRDHVGAYGAMPSPTPQLDALAREGLVHERAYTTMPTTGPAHLSLFTGRYPSQLGATQNAVPLSPRDADRSLAEQLARAGYSTGAFVTSPLAAPGATGLPGFGVYEAPAGVLRAGDDAVDAALSWLASGNTARPVFVWLHLYDAHAPYGDMDQKRRGIPLDESLYGYVDVASIEAAGGLGAFEANYARGVAKADAALGRFVAGAREILAEPLVIVVADHGESLVEHLATRGYAFDHGEYLDEEAISIPLVVAGPDVSPGRSGGAASIRDLYTTILEAAGIGDPTAIAEERRDLRRKSEARRVVAIERRSFERNTIAGEEEHLAAVSDGKHLVVVDSAFELVAPSGPGTVPPDLARLAALRAQATREAHAKALPVLSPEARDALRQLGYAE